jgi:APA family basic amino acid/polyamine antiporter
MAQVMLLITDRERFSARHLLRDGLIATVAFVYSMWAIAGSGSDVVFKGTILLLAGTPVYVWMRWEALRTRVRPTGAAGAASGPVAAAGDAGR